MSPSPTGPGSWTPANIRSGPSGPVPCETKTFCQETVFVLPRNVPETNGVQITPAKQWSSAMWELINALYREYCRARISEMRKFSLAH